MGGEVRRVIQDLRLGIIRAKDGKEFCFCRSALWEGDFATLAKGDVVESYLTIEQHGMRVADMPIKAGNDQGRCANSARSHSVSRSRRL